MMKPAAARTSDAVSFGSFTLAAGERLLTKGGARVELGARTLDVLVALVARPNEVISKRELLAQAWPDTIVDEGSLRFQVASLRKALGDGEGGARYIATVAGRGYCFVAPISSPGDRDEAQAEAAAGSPQANLPGRLAGMVGRSDDARALSTQLMAARFVTVVGSGGVGKTTVAVAVGHDLTEAFAGAVVFVDLGALSDPALTATTIASLLGLSVQSDDPTPGLIAYLRDRRMLLILDTCEHLIEPVAALAERIFSAAPRVHILATSREALRARGEHVFKLGPLACPPYGPGLTAASVRRFPAAELFLERAAAGGARLDLDDADAAIIADICRKLGGVALAIELAAGRVEAYGLRQTARLLDQRLTLLWPGQRTAPPRQRTLLATLDWSFGLLSELERAVLRRLAVFVGHFTLEAALEVVSGAVVERDLVFAAVDSLVAKSMVAARPAGAMMRYRLLDTTRVYALEIGPDDAELAGLARRHAAYYRQWLEQTGSRWPSLSSAAERALHHAGLGNVRAALEWCFGADGDAEAGVGLAAAAAPVFLSMSLLPECQRWSERALSALGEAARGGFEEMHLQAALGVSLMFTRGGSQAARAALGRSFAIATERGGALDQLQLLGPLNMFHLRTGDFRAALEHARRCSVAAGTVEDSVAVALAHSVLGMSLHLSGDLGGARRELEAALRHAPREQRTMTVHLGFEGRSLAGAVLARTLWLQGCPARAAERARQAVEDAARMDHPLTLSIALIWAISVLLWTGDLRGAEQYVDRLIDCAESHSLAPHLWVGRGFEGELAIRRGDASSGVATLRNCLDELHAAPYELLTTTFHIALAQGLAAVGRFAEGVALIDDTMRMVEANGDGCYMPELLRVKGNLLLAMPQLRGRDAESCFVDSLEMSRRQGARAWELRTGVDLAALLAAQGQPDHARALLRPMLQHFGEGSGTADLEAAGRLLATLGSSESWRPGRAAPKRAARSRRSGRAVAAAKP